VNDVDAPWLEGLLGHVEAHGSKLSAWEAGFMADQRARYEEHGEQMRVSAKQWTVIERIAQKLRYDDRPRSDEDDFMDDE
jgi:hypothetical protein